MGTPGAQVLVSTCYSAIKGLLEIELTPGVGLEHLMSKSKDVLKKFGQRDRGQTEGAPN